MTEASLDDQVLAEGVGDGAGRPLLSIVTMREVAGRDAGPVSRAKSTRIRNEVCPTFSADSSAMTSRTAGPVR